MESRQTEQDWGRLRSELTDRDWVGLWSGQYDLDTETQKLNLTNNVRLSLRPELDHWMCDELSREESSELRDKLLFPPTGEVDGLSAASDIAADTCSLLLTDAACLKDVVNTVKIYSSYMEHAVNHGVLYVLWPVTGKNSHQSSRAAVLLFDVVHQETKDSLTVLSSLINSTRRQLKHNTHVCISHCILTGTFEENTVQWVPVKDPWYLTRFI